MTHDAVVVSAKIVDAPLLDRRHAKKTGRVRRGASGQKNPNGIIETYAKKGGWVDIDAIVPASVATGMFEAMCGNPRPRHMHVFQSEPGGMVLVDARVSTPVAAIICTMAQRVGVPIRRHA